MNETFTLQGESPQDSKPRKGLGSKLLVFVVLAFVALLVWAMFENRPISSGVGDYGKAFEAAAKRKEAFEQLLPGKKIPEPFVIRSVSTLPDGEAIWLRRDFDDTHALLLAGSALSQASIAALLRPMGIDRLPTRKLIDEDGVQPDKRPPFVEEFREIKISSNQVRPPADWAAHWDETQASLSNASTDQSSDSVNLVVSANKEYPMVLYQESPPYWWTLVDLSAELDSGGELFLLHALKTKRAPTTDQLIDFVREMLRLET